MGLFSKMGQSADLVSGMSERLGVDLSDAVARDPEIEGYKYRRAVMRCSQCSDQEGCLKLQANSTHLDQAPSYCMNKDLFEHTKNG
ncbi:MAG: adenylosuccinate lyase [Rhodobacteraceae bacterium]|nr:adenylosuccinate lyase [Paracoccaceae bacterium]